MACNVHITFFWGQAKNQHVCQHFSNELIRLLAPTFLAKSSAGINSVTAANQGPRKGCSLFSCVMCWPLLSSDEP